VVKPQLHRHFAGTVDAEPGYPRASFSVAHAPSPRLGLELDSSLIEPTAKLERRLATVIDGRAGILADVVGLEWRVFEGRRLFDAAELLQ
jgi:hypothetical protein